MTAVSNTESSAPSQSYELPQRFATVMCLEVERYCVKKPRLLEREEEEEENQWEERLETSAELEEEKEYYKHEHQERWSNVTRSKKNDNSSYCKRENKHYDCYACEEETKLDSSQFSAFQTILPQWVNILMTLTQIRKLEHEQEYEEQEEEELQNSKCEISIDHEDKVKETQKFVYDVDTMTDSQCTTDKHNSVIEQHHNWLFGNINNIIEEKLNFVFHQIIPSPWEQMSKNSSQNNRGVLRLVTSIEELCRIFHYYHYEQIRRSSNNSSNNHNSITNKEDAKLENDNHHLSTIVCLKQLVASLKSLVTECIEPNKTITTPANSKSSSSSNNVSNNPIWLDVVEFVTLMTKVISNNAAKSLCNNNFSTYNKEYLESESNINNNSKQDSCNSSLDVICESRKDAMRHEVELAIELHAKTIFYELLRLTKDITIREEDHAEVVSVKRNRVYLAHIYRVLEYCMLYLEHSNETTGAEHKSQTNESSSELLDNEINNNNSNNKSETKVSTSVGMLYGLALHNPMYHVIEDENNISSKGNDKQKRRQNYNKNGNQNNRMGRYSQSGKHKRKRFGDCDSDSNSEENDESDVDVIEETVVEEMSECNSFKHIDLQHSRWRRAQRWRDDVIRQRKTQKTSKEKLCGSNEENEHQTENVPIDVTEYNIAIAAGVLTCFNVHQFQENNNLRPGHCENYNNVKECYARNVSVNWFTQSGAANDKSATLLQKRSSEFFHHKNSSNSSNNTNNSMQIEKLLQSNRTKSKTIKRINKKS